MVVAFGGDGTVNEAANGLAGSEVPLTLPARRPDERPVPDARDPDRRRRRHRALLRMADDFTPRRVRPRWVDERAFTFSAGVGLDASVVEQVDAHPRLKARLGEWYYTWTGVATFNRHYLIRPPRLEATLGWERSAASRRSSRTARRTRTSATGRWRWARARRSRAAICRGRPTRASPVDIPTIIWRALSGSAQLIRHRRVHGFSGVDGLSVRSVDGRELPLQVDGDYIGTASRRDFRVEPRGITLVA